MMGVHVTRGVVTVLQGCDERVSMLASPGDSRKKPPHAGRLAANNTHTRYAPGTSTVIPTGHGFSSDASLNTSH